MTIDPIQLVRTALSLVVCEGDLSATLAGATVRPLRLPASEGPAPDMVHISDALSAKALTVRELEPPQVQGLNFHNVGERPVFVPAGTLVRGGGQDRIVAVSSLLRPGEARKVAVRCVEAGRWNPRTRGEFRSSSSSPMSLKSRKMTRDTLARFHGRERADDQSATWSDVQALLSATHTSSPTSSLFAAVDRVEREQAPEGPLPERIASADGLWMEGVQSAAAELFPVPGLRASGMRALQESAALEPRGPRAEGLGSFELLRADLLANGHFAVQEVPGGHLVDFRGSARGVAGSAFVAEGHVLHLALAEAA